MLRRVETLDPDRKTVNVFMVPPQITLEKAMNKQNNANFRDRYFHLSYQAPVNLL